MKNVTADVFDLYANFSCYRACYSALTNNSNITRAQVRCQHKSTECEEVDPSSSLGEIDDTEQEFQPVKKTLQCKLFAREKSRILLSR